MKLEFDRDLHRRLWRHRCFMQEIKLGRLRRRIGATTFHPARPWSARSVHLHAWGARLSKRHLLFIRTHGGEW